MFGELRPYEGGEYGARNNPFSNAPSTIVSNQKNGPSQAKPMARGMATAKPGPAHRTAALSVGKLCFQASLGPVPGDRVVQPSSGNADHARADRKIEKSLD